MVLPRPEGMPEVGAAAKLVWNSSDYELHWNESLPDAPEQVEGTRATVDLGQIHQATVVIETGEALIVSGRGIRSEKRGLSKMHGWLAKRQSRCRKGSRRWRKLQRARNRQATRAVRRIRDRHHKGVRAAVDCCAAHGVNRIYVGHPQACATKAAVAATTSA